MIEQLSTLGLWIVACLIGWQREDGSARCWGSNGSGEVGDEDGVVAAGHASTTERGGGGGAEWKTL